MESSDLSPHSSDDASFESWLRSNSQLPVLPDDGFTHRTCRALPTPDRRYVKRSWFCAAGLLAGTLFALVGLFVSHGSAEASRITEFDFNLSSPAALAAWAITAASLGYAFRGELRRFLHL